MKQQVNRFVYLALSLLFLATTILAAPWSVSAAITTPVKLSSLTAGDTVNFSGKTWIVLDPGTGYLLMQGFENARAYDPDNTPFFDPADANNIAHYLNQDFYNSLFPEDRPLILYHHWTTGVKDNESLSFVICNVGLISRSEWDNYSNKKNPATGILDNPPLSFKFRTPFITGPDIPDELKSIVVGAHETDGFDYYSPANYEDPIRPALYVCPNALVYGGNGGTVLGGKYHTLKTLINTLAGGAVTGGGVYAGGDPVAVTANPSAGYTFVNWVDQSGTVVSNSPSFSYTMGTRDEVLVANFQAAAGPAIIPAITVVNGVPFSVNVRSTYGTLTGTNNAYGTLTGAANGNDTVISGTLSGLPVNTPTDIPLGNGVIEVKAVNPPSTTLDNTKSFY